MDNKNKAAEAEKEPQYVCVRDLPVSDTKGKVKILKAGAPYKSKSKRALGFMVSQNKIKKA